MTEDQEPPPTFVKRAHKRGCEGSLYRCGLVHIDRTGRLDNGGIVAHDYVCNHRSWDGCNARVLVTEQAVRELAVAVERRVL